MVNNKKIPVKTLKNNPTDIAIIGIACRLPGANNYEEFWKNLESGKVNISEIPKNRWNWEKYFGDPHTDESKTSIKWGGFIKDVDKFDPLFFNISPQEAQLMDPQQRILLEQTWSCIEDAGYSPSKLSGSKTGVFIGACHYDYKELLEKNVKSITGHSSTGTHICIIPNRISYIYNFKGPSILVDTACSSSIVAIDQAIKSIKENECDLALAGGVNIICTPTQYISYDKRGMLSKDGICRSFDANANGYVRGEGAALILLKKLTKAIHDRNHIYGIIRGNAINHDGHTSTLTSPSPYAQAKVIFDAHKKADIPPNSISFIEAHGTGTPLGDPIEFHGLTRAFSKLNKYFGIKSKKENYCGLGTAKANVGHLESVSGVVGIIKVLLSMKYKKLPKIQNFTKLNPRIKLKGSPFYIQDKILKWETNKNNKNNSTPLRAGISSFGLGGTNGHMVIEEYIFPSRRKNRKFHEINQEELIILSAKNEKQLSESIYNLKTYLEKDENENLSLQDIAYTLQVRREIMHFRMAIVVKNKAELLNKLGDYVEKKDDIDGLYTGNIRKNKRISNILEDEDIRELVINKWVEKRKLHRIAELWVWEEGFGVDWNILHKNQNRRRISLPTYPFARESYWIKPLGINKLHDDNSEYLELSNPLTTTEPNLKSNNKVENFVNDKKNEILNMFYIPSWENEQILPEKSQAEDKQRAILIIVGNEDLGLTQKLINSYKRKNIWIVKLGKKLKYISKNKLEINHTRIEDFINVIENITDLQYIYFLGGLRSRKKEIKNIKSLEKTQDFGVLSMFRLVKALLHEGYSHKFLGFKVLTNNINKVLNSDPEISPFAGSLIGFAKVVSREYPTWSVQCIDINQDEVKSDQLIDNIKQEVYSNEIHEVSLRTNKRFVQKIEKVNIKENIEKKLLLKNKGVYVIVGGMGGIGFEVCKGLTQLVKARLVIVGSSEYNSKIEENIKKIENTGGEALYFPGDITSIEDMKEMVKVSIKKFGEINGIIHSAVVLKDSSISKMSESVLNKVLAPKVHGLFALHQVTKNIPLDFFTIFSSFNSFYANAGQSNYVAGCRFKDSFGNYLSNVNRIPVKVINWGYWDDTGVAKGNYYKKKLVQLGLNPIKNSEGIAALNSIFNNNCYTQIISAKFNNNLLNEEVMFRKSNYSFENRIEIEACGKNIKSIKKTKIEPSTIEENNIQGFLVDYLRNIFIDALKLDSSSFDIEESFEYYGIDSIVVLEIMNRLIKDFGNISRNILFENTSVVKLSKYLLQNYPEIVTNRFSENITIKNSNEILNSDKSLSTHKNNGSSLTPINISLQKFPNVEVLVCGKGEPLVFLSGLGMTAHIWKNQITKLSNNYRLIFIHYPGHGNSDYSKVSISFQNIVNIIASVLGKMEVDTPVNLLGWCMGGMIAQMMAVKYPAVIKSLILVSSNSNFNKFLKPNEEWQPTTGKSDKLSYSKRMGNFYKKDPFASKFIDLIESSVDVDKRAIFLYQSEIAKFDFTSNLQKIKLPTLVLWGKNDRFYKNTGSKILSKEIKNAKFYEFEEGGHAPFLTRSELFNQKVSEFIGNIINCNYFSIIFTAKAQSTQRIWVKYVLTVAQVKTHVPEFTWAKTYYLNSASDNIFSSLRANFSVR